MIKSCNALRIAISRKNESRKPPKPKPPSLKPKSKRQKMKISLQLSAMSWTPSMSLMMITERKLLRPKLRLPSQLQRRRPSRQQKKTLKRLRLRKTRSSSLKASMPVKCRMEVKLQPHRMAINVAAAEIIVAAAAMEKAEEVAMATGEVAVKIVATIVEDVVVVTEVVIITTAAAVAATIASQPKMKTASLWRLERSPSHVTGVTTTEEAEVTAVVNSEEAAVKETETVEVAVVVVADTKTLTEEKMALLDKNNSQLLAKLERKRARTNNEMMVASQMCRLPRPLG